MKMNRNLNFFRVLALAAAGITAVTNLADAASFNYTPADLILGFRLSGRPDAVIDIGQASIYDAVPAGQTIPVTNLPTGLTTLLNTAFSSLDGVSWSVTGTERAAGTYPLQTIWATAARANTNVQSTPWPRQGQFAQGGPASQIAAIGANAATYSSAHPGSASNTVSGLLIPFTDGNSYTKAIQDPNNPSNGDIGGYFYGNVENTTPFDFVEGPDGPSVSDLYELQPGSGPGTYVGYFSFTPDGNVTFTAATVGPFRPTITSIKRSGNVTTISFTSQNSFIYGLVSSAVLTAQLSTWTATGGTASGTGSVLSLQATNASAALYYAVTAH
jgi:hypothetical protein